MLTLTATPIPRTLEMSLTGIRDLTLLNTPPADRQPILTYVGEYDERAVGEAIRRELLREGQVFFVHNRVQDIERTAEHVRDLVPEARVAVAHGQMDEGTLEQVVLDFWEGEYDVLVCTTIIESGIDMPTVNTLVVDRADLLGLGQLHQLRGPGRPRRASGPTPTCSSRPTGSLSEEAYERLKTIGEATELGSGFKIAMRDLEIRGAGNLLGTGQSGHIAAVGYDLYCQMVTEAVAELKGEPVKEPAEIKLDLPLDANLPPRLRAEGGAAPRGLPPPGRGDHRRRGRRHPRRVGGPLRPAARAGRGAPRRSPACGPSASRTGVREITVVKPSGFGGAPSTARLSPLPLKASQQIRLQRLHPTAVYKEPDQLLIVRSTKAQLADRLEPDTYPMSLVTVILQQRIDLNLHNAEFADAPPEAHEHRPNGRPLVAVQGDSTVAQQALRGGFVKALRHPYVDDISRQYAVETRSDQQGLPGVAQQGLPGRPHRVSPATAPDGTRKTKPVVPLRPAPRTGRDDHHHHARGPQADR